MRPRRSIQLVLGSALALALTGAGATAALACPPEAAAAAGVAPTSAVATVVDAAAVDAPVPADGFAPGEFVQCMTEHGAPPPVFHSSSGEGEGQVPGSDTGGGQRFDAAEEPEHAAAFEMCEQYLPDPGQGGGVHCVVVGSGGVGSGGVGSGGVGSGGVGSGGVGSGEGLEPGMVLEPGDGPGAGGVAPAVPGDAPEGAPEGGLVASGGGPAGPGTVVVPEDSGGPHVQFGPGPAADGSDDEPALTRCPAPAAPGTGPAGGGAVTDALPLTVVL